MGRQLPLPTQLHSLRLGVGRGLGVCDAPVALVVVVPLYHVELASGALEAEGGEALPKLRAGDEVMSGAIFSKPNQACLSPPTVAVHSGLD